MCRYAYSGPCKDRYACFACRKAFKRRKAGDLPPKMQPSAGQEPPAVRCPQCGGPMQNLGMDFKAPRQADLRQWRKVERLFAHGFTFHSCGCGPGLRPAELGEVEGFLEENAQRNPGRELLATINRRSAERARHARRRRHALARELSGRLWGPVVPHRHRVSKPLPRPKSVAELVKPARKRT